MNPGQELKIAPSNVSVIAKKIIAINILLLAGTFIFNTSRMQIFRETDLASENVFAAWYSSMLLLLSAVLSFYCFMVDERRIEQNSRRVWNFGWLVYAAAFATLSFDELGSIHEHIGSFTAFKQAGNLVTNTKDSGWVFFYVVVGVVSLFMLMFSILKLKEVKWSLLLLVTGLLLYLSNPFQEYFEIETMRAAGGEQSWRRPVNLLLLEEGSEIFGSLSFFTAIALYAKQYPYRIETNKFPVVRVVVYCFLGAAICLLLIDVLFGDVRGDEQNGVPKNWITAAAAFLLSVYCFFTYNTEKTNSYLLFGIFLLCLSVYFGSNRFAWYFNADYSQERLMLKSFLSLFALICYMLLIKNAGSSVFKMLGILSFMMVAAGIFIKRQYSAEMVFAGVGCLAVLMIDRVKKPTANLVRSY